MKKKIEFFIKKYIVSDRELLLIKTNIFKNLLFIAIDVSISLSEINDLLNIACREYKKTFQVKLKKFMPAPFSIPLKDEDKYDTLLFIYKEEDYEHEFAELPTDFWNKKQKEAVHIKKIKQAISEIEKSQLLILK